MPILYPTSTGHAADDRYSPLVEPNLFAGNVFQPGLTFTDKYTLGAAGQIMVHKPGVGTVTSTHPGADFSDVVVKDELITIILNKQFQRSRKMYGVTDVSVAYNAAAVEIETAVAEVRAGWNLEAAQALLTGGGILITSTNTATAANAAYEAVVDARQALRKQKANPDVMIVSPDFYGKLLKAPEFQRSVEVDTNVIRDAYVGRVAGVNVFEYEELATAIPNGTVVDGFINAATTASNITWNATSDAVEFVIYDHDAFSIVTSLEAVRVLSGDQVQTFIGSLAQVSIVSGFKVTNGKRVLAKIVDAA